MKQIPGEFLQVVDNDIQAIDDLLASNTRYDEKIKALHMVLGGRYQASKEKWEKIRPILTWLADKSVDIWITFLPLLLKL